MKTGNPKVSSEPHPNLLLLFSDQYHAGVMGCEGHPDAITPNLDRLAAEGVRFSRAYCQDAICAPSRCSLFSGLYPRTLGCLDNPDQSPVMEGIVSLQRTLQDNGYVTAAFGKRHLHRGCDAGWDIRASHLANESPEDNYVRWVGEQGYGDAFASDWAAEFGQSPPGESGPRREIPFALMATRDSALPDGLTMEAWTKHRTVEFLREQREGERPFFCFASFYRPHQPYTPLPSFLKHFGRSRWGEGTLHGDAIRMPASLRQDPAELPPMLQGLFRGANRVWRLDLARQDEQLYRDYIAAYYALAMEIDHHIGHILHELDILGLRDNTIVIYASDHGDFVGAHGMVEKCAHGHNVYEDTLQVPLIVSWPRQLRQGVECRDLVELVDLYPTVVDLLGLDLPADTQELQGLSLGPTLSDGVPLGRAYTVSENWSQATVVTDRHKLGAWIDPGPLPRNRGRDWRGQFPDQLFDRRNDPLEMTNLIGRPEFAEVEQQLRAQLVEWMEKTPDTGKRALMA